MNNSIVILENIIKNKVVTFKNVKVACRVQIWEERFCQNSDKFGYSFIKNDIRFMYTL